MRNIYWIAFSVALLIAGNAAAEGPAPTRFSIAPFAGYRVGGSFTDATTGDERKLDEAQNYGVAIDINATPETEVELLWSRQRSAVNGVSGAATPSVGLRIDYFHIGGTYLFATDGVIPFFGATIGATRFEPTADGYDSETRFSFGLVGGVRVPLTRHFGLRLEARGYGTVLSNDSESLCVNGRCLIKADGTLFWQYEANAGVYLAF
jgi:opacity protein-like surface antigen